MKKQLKLRLALIAAGLLGIVLGFLMLPALIFAPSSSNTDLGALCGSTYPMSAASSVATSGHTLSGEQLDNARTIIGIGQSMGVSAYEAKLAVWTSYQESRLRDLTYGDADSLGLFQQRPSQGWGTPEQILNPNYAATKFYQAVIALRPEFNLGPNSGALTYLQYALSVQHADASAYLSPDNFFPGWEPLVDSILKLEGVDLSAATTTVTETAGASGPGAVGSFTTVCSSTTDSGIPGKIVIAPGANLPGQPITPETMDFLAQVATIYGKPLIVTTGTNHNFYVEGTSRESDHATGHAADIGMAANGGTIDGPVGDAIATACLEAAGVPTATAITEADQGGLWTIDNASLSLRIQCIWKTDEGGDHHNHVHIGAAPLQEVGG